MITEISSIVPLFEDLGLESPEEAAASSIQRVWKRHTDTYFTQGKHYIDDLGSLYSSLPRALNGRTTVFLPKEPPIVLKQSGAPQNKRRLDQMIAAQAICSASGYTHLSIPRATLYRNFIIESRLPLTHFNQYGPMAYYAEHQALFTEAVQELTGFLFQADLNDLFTDNRAFLHVEICDGLTVGRYDNIPPYLVNGSEGKIGLVDLETFVPRSRRREGRAICATMVRLFPYHLENILMVARSIDPDIDRHKEYLESLQEQAFIPFQVPLQHQAFIKAYPDTFPIEHLSVSRKEELKRFVAEEALRLHTTPLFPGMQRFCIEEAPGMLEHEGILGEDSKATLADFNENIFPVFLDKLIEVMVSSCKEELLAGSRLLQFDPCELFSPISKELFPKMRLFKFRPGGQRILFVISLADAVLSECVRGGEIAYYKVVDPGYNRLICY